MNPRQILIAAIRLFVIVWMVQTFSRVSVLLSVSETDGYWAQAYPLYLIYAACWLLMWLFPATITKWLLPDYALTKESETPQNPTCRIAAAVAVIGVFTLQDALTDAAYWSSYLYLAGADTGGWKSVWQLLDTHDKSSVVLTAAQTVIGAFLVLRAAAVARYINHHIDA